MSDQPVAKADTYTAHNKQKSRTSIPSAGFESAIPATQQLKGLCLRRQDYRDQFTGILLHCYYSSVAEFLANCITMTIKGKGKAVPQQARCGPDGSRRFRLTHFHDIRHTKVVRLSASRSGRLYPQECSWFSFSLGTESTPGPWYGRKEICH